ncbi:MAG: hypothetical protein ACE15E_17350 [Acidobacteriota bacterium]
MIVLTARSASPPKKQDNVASTCSLTSESSTWRARVLNSSEIEPSTSATDLRIGESTEDGCADVRIKKLDPPNPTF